MKKLFLVALASWLLVFAPACGLFGGEGKAPASAADTIERAAALAFNGATVALEVIDAAEARYLDTIQKPTADDVAHAELRVERIKRARDALAVVRKWLAGERGTATAELGDAAELLGLVAQELQSRGVQIPKRVTDGLQLASAFARVGAS